MLLNKIFFGVVLFAILGFASCSKCYTCKTEVEYQTSNGVTTDSTEEDLCTASQQEVKDKEDAGYRCEPN